jgi:LysM repeat protein
VRRPTSTQPPDTTAIGPDPELAGLVGGGAAASAAASSATPYPPSSRSGQRPTVSSSRAIDPALERERERERAAAAADRNNPHDGPSWERARRYEAYPTIRPRIGVPGLPRVTVLAAALAIAALALFFLPGFLNLGGGGGPAATPSSSVAPSDEPSPTPVPAPTAQSYVIKEGDTLSKIARRFGVSLDALLAANQDTIKDPNKIAIGDAIIIPPAGSDEITDGEASPEASS